jgi:hypothetical protein
MRPLARRLLAGQSWPGPTLVPHPAVPLEAVHEIARIFPSHVKVIKAEMRVLTDAQQNSVIYLCRRLRHGDILKFIREITTVEREEIG